MSSGHEYRYVGEVGVLEEPGLEAGGSEDWLPCEEGDTTGVKVVAEPRPLLSVEEASRIVQEADRAGDFAGKMEGRANLIKAIYLGRVAVRPPVPGKEVQVKAEKKAVAAPVEGKAVVHPHNAGGYSPLAEGDLECRAVAGGVLGYTGETYCGRRVVAFRKDPVVFGGEPVKREAVVRLTLHKGILNHMELRQGKGPTPYWAVMDAASDLKSGFTTEEVLIRALAVLGDDSRLDACRIAWYVLKSHHTHPKERYRGMSYMVDEAPDGRMSIRARKPGEVAGHTPKARVERAAVPASQPAGGAGHEVPIVTHVVSKVR